MRGFSGSLQLHERPSVLHPDFGEHLGGESLSADQTDESGSEMRKLIRKGKKDRSVPEVGRGGAKDLAGRGWGPGFPLPSPPLSRVIKSVKRRGKKGHQQIGINGKRKRGSRSRRSPNKKTPVLTILALTGGSPRGGSQKKINLRAAKKKMRTLHLLGDQ